MKRDGTAGAGGRLMIGNGLRESIGMWLRGERPTIDPLPGRPPDGIPPVAGAPRPAAAPGPAATARTTNETDTGAMPMTAPEAAPGRTVRAICCSGGGIRAAAFSLGGMQGLSRRDGDRPSWYDGVDLVTAVSGGSYIASSMAMVNHTLTDGQRAELPPYAPGSPEDNRLRSHTRYLVEDHRVAMIGVLAILYGLLLNLLPILAGLYVGAKLLGWGLYSWGILTRSDNAWEVEREGVALAIAGGLLVAGLVLFAIERIHEIYRPPEPRRSKLFRAWSLRLLGSAAIVAVALLGVPAALQLLSTSRLDFAPAGVGWPAQLTGFVAMVSGLVALVKGTVGRFKGKLQASPSGTRSGGVGAWIGRVLRAAAPWIGSAVAVALLALAFLTWTTSAAFDGLQWHEYVLMLLAVAGMVGWQSVTDVNRNSVHSFYKERLSSAFAVERRPDGTADEIDYGQPIHFSSFARDKPELVVCAAVNTDEEGVVPSGRGCAPFTFSPLWTGVSSGTMFAGESTCDAVGAERMRPTATYEKLAGPRLMTLPAAVAVSGAAVSPVMGRMTRAPLRLLLGLANVRLGLWLPNPLRRDLRYAPGGAKPSFGALVRWQLRQPGIRSLLQEMLGRTGLRGRWVYVTDGGHYENLGLVEALRRGATEIVVFDASGDQPHTWTTFGEAVQTARADLGVEIDVDPSTMAPPDGSDRAATLVVRGECRYPNGSQATLLYCKLALPVAAPKSWDVLAWASGHPNFPHDSTAQQLYGDREFEAYRRLGELAARTALNVLSVEQSRPHSANGRTGTVPAAPVPV